MDYKRPIFSAPLSECVFQDYTINTSWVGASLPMTPLFSSSQMSMDIQGMHGEDRDGEFDGATHHRPMMIRATMTPSLSQAVTQTQGGTLSSTQGVNGSVLYGLSQRPGGAGYIKKTGLEEASWMDPALHLRRRILNPRATQSQVISDVHETELLLFCFLRFQFFVQNVYILRAGFDGSFSSKSKARSSFKTSVFGACKQGAHDEAIPHW